MNILPFVTILLIGRLVSLRFVIPPLLFQLRLLSRLPLEKTPKQKKDRLNVIRILIVSMAVTLFTLGIDILTLLQVDLGRPSNIPWILVTYSFSFNFSYLLFTHHIWSLWRSSQKENE